MGTAFNPAAMAWQTVLAIAASFPEVQIMKGEIRSLRVCKVSITETAWFDIRRCDGGTMLSFCEEKVNARYTVILDGNTVKLKEVEPLSPPPKDKEKKKRKQ